MGCVCVPVYVPLPPKSASKSDKCKEGLLGTEGCPTDACGLLLGKEGHWKHSPLCGGTQTSERAPFWSAANVVLLSLSQLQSRSICSAAMCWGGGLAQLWTPSLAWLWGFAFLFITGVQ